jgi:hypothetical protein
MTSPEPEDEIVAVMVEVARTAGLDLDPAQRDIVAQLIEEGFVVPLDASAPSGQPRYELSRKGQQWLDARGVGANEA